MPDKAEFEDKFWKALKSDMTVMLATIGADARPMTAQLDGDKGPIYFFTSSETEIAKALGGKEKKAVLTFASKGHDLFANVQGKLAIDTDQAVIDRLWNRFVAAWFENGKEDPKLTLLRFDPDQAEIWMDASSFVAGIKLLLGFDPKVEYKDKVAEISLR